MVFASLSFLCFFLPLNILLYYIWQNRTYQNLILTLFSLFFYAWGEPFWIILLLFSALLDYSIGLFIDSSVSIFWRKAGLVLSLCTNLGLLGTFKYGGFLCENLNYITGLGIPVPTISLPIGISFYTFQTMSYVIDVYRKEVSAQRSFIKFLMFVSLYHQLVAGPIVRYSEIVNDIENRQPKLAEISSGIWRFCIGLFKKVYFSNIAAELVKQFLDGDFNQLTVAEAWVGLLCYALHIYFDFSGYSDMAIGLGWMFGFHYRENFNYPYTATSATDFWRRWHISLGSFFRDYVYIPLGGNKKNVYRNLLIVWCLTGLWHGASWNFVLWGLFFGILITLEKLFLLDVFKFFWWLPLARVYFIFIVLIGWALFYFTDLERLWQFMQLLFGVRTNEIMSLRLEIVLWEHAYWLAAALIACLPVYHWLSKGFKPLGTRFAGLITLFQISIQFVMLAVSISLLVGNSFNPFIYFRF